LKQTDQIKLAFAHDRAVRLDQRALSLVQTKKNAAFSKKGCFRRIQIFRGSFLLFENAAAKRDHLTDVIADRKHNSVTKAIVACLMFACRAVAPRRLDVLCLICCVFCFDQATLEQLTRTESLPSCPTPKRVPFVRGVPEPPSFRYSACD